MLVICCPHCGMRDHTEFTYGGDATRPRPDTAGKVDDATWTAYLYLRENPAGSHVEFWHHTLGCRQWLRASRDTTTQRISSVSRGRPPAPGGAP